MTAAPISPDALAELTARIEQHAEKIRRLDVTVRALARLRADAADPADTRLVASDATPAEIAVPWPTRADPVPAADRFALLGRALAGVVHDFNNLLAVIQGNAELLAEGTRPAAAQRESIELITVAADLAAGLTQNLLAVARPTADPPARVDVNLQLGRLDRVLKAVCGSRVRVAVTPGLNVPAAAVGPAGLTQVVLNLAVNARDAMPDGGTLAIRTAAQVVGPDRPGVPPGEYVVLTVTDTGVGMDEASRVRLFDPAADRGGGLGLGIVRDVVTAAGGAVEVESAFGWGTQVRVYFPRA